MEPVNPPQNDGGSRGEHSNEIRELIRMIYQIDTTTDCGMCGVDAKSPLKTAAIGKEKPPAKLKVKA